MTDTWAWLIPAACLVHGLGMVGGAYIVFTTPGWLLAVVPARLEAPVKALVALVWVVSGLAFVAAAWGLFRETGWRRTAMWLAAPTTIAGVALWVSRRLPPGVYVGAAGCMAAIVALARGW